MVLFSSEVMPIPQCLDDQAPLLCSIVSTQIVDGHTVINDMTLPYICHFCTPKHFQAFCFMISNQNVDGHLVIYVISHMGGFCLALCVFFKICWKDPILQILTGFYRFLHLRVEQLIISIKFALIPATFRSTPADICHFIFALISAMFRSTRQQEDGRMGQSGKTALPGRFLLLKQ